MNIRLMIFGLMTILFDSCTTTKYFLPEFDKIGVSEYGSFIQILQHDGKKIEGELLAVEEHSIIVLASSAFASDTSIRVAVNKISKFKLRYAQPKHYGWTIPAYTIVCLSHGFWAALTIPVNLITTISVTVAGENAYTYDGKKISYEGLKMFARFPQGIPPNVKLTSIK